MEMLILDAAEAVVLTGETSPGAFLEPRALADGVTWVLPVAVLDDPAHAGIHDVLEALPRRDVLLSEFPLPPEE